MYIPINRLNIYYQKVGSGKDLILLHGWGNDVSSFWGILDNLKDDFTVWLIDLPGFGRSDTPKNGFTVSDYVEIIKEFIKTNQLKKPHLLGHSLGGRVGIKLAAQHPELIDKLILESAAGIRHQTEYTKLLLQLAAQAFNVIIPNLFNLKEKLKYNFYSYMESDYLTAKNMAPTLKKLLDEDLTPYLAKIPNQTLVIWGQNDQEVPVSDGKIIYQKIPDSRLEILEGVGHFPHLENPELFLYWLKDFLE